MLTALHDFDREIIGGIVVKKLIEVLLEPYFSLPWKIKDLF